MKLRPTEETLLRLLREAGGSYCVDASSPIGRDVWRAANRLQSKGLLDIEETDAGPRFTVREAAHG